MLFFHYFPNYITSVYECIWNFFLFLTNFIDIFTTHTYKTQCTYVQNTIHTQNHHAPTPYIVYVYYFREIFTTFPSDWSMCSQHTLKNTTQRQKTQLKHHENTIHSPLIMLMFSTFVKFLLVHSYENDIFSLFYKFLPICMLIRYSFIVLYSFY